MHAGIDVPGTANAGAQDSGAGSTLPAVTRDADVSMAVSFLLVGVTLYLLFRYVDRRTAAAPVVYLAVGVGLLVVNMLFHHARCWLPPPPPPAVSAPRASTASCRCCWT